MVAEIREELRRSGMDNAIKRGIGAAVLFHRDKRFAWNEANFSFTTTASQPDYDSSDNSAIGRLATIDVMKVVTPETYLNPRTIEYIRSLLDRPTGTPADFAYFAQAITLSPTPSSTLTINIDGVLELYDANQSSTNQIISRDNILTIPDGYSTAWFGAGYEIIKAWAKSYIYLHHLRNVDQSAAQGSASQTLRDDQIAQIGRLGGSGFVTPTAF